MDISGAYGICGSSRERTSRLPRPSLPGKPKRALSPAMRTSLAWATSTSASPRQSPLIAAMTGFAGRYTGARAQASPSGVPALKCPPAAPRRMQAVAAGVASNSPSRALSSAPSAAASALRAPWPSSAMVATGPSRV